MHDPSKSLCIDFTAQNSIQKFFPKALPNKEFVAKVSAALAPKGFTSKNTLVAASLCCDELSRPLEQVFNATYGNHFSMGGLAGFPFGGVVSFGAMASHIPDGGHCLLCYGPHVGVCSKGHVGTVERIGRVNGGACCGSANAACAHVLASTKSNPQAPPSNLLTPIGAPVDAQQQMVGNMLMPHAARLANAKEVQAELAYALFDAQTEMINEIISKAAGAVADGHIACVGGIQINTPPGMEDYFEPSRFDIFDNKGNKIDEIQV